MLLIGVVMPLFQDGWSIYAILFVLAVLSCWPLVGNHVTAVEPNETRPSSYDATQYRRSPAMSCK